MGYRLGTYLKYIYWVEPDELPIMLEALGDHGIEPYETKRAVCVPLSKKVDVGIVYPSAWQQYELCKRQLSWYQVSGYRGKTLVITTKQFDAWTLKPYFIVRDTKFKPPSLPSYDEQLKMIKRKSYLDARPETWEKIEDEDSQLHERWLKIMGLRGISYPELFVTHCANHANFIEPIYYIEQGGEKVPYSIARTSHICSACLEFCGIIGDGLNKKLVVPCPGAVLFAGLAPNRYYEVVRFTVEEGK